MPEFLNGNEAAGWAALACRPAAIMGRQTNLIFRLLAEGGKRAIEKLGMRDYNPEFLELTGESAVSGAAARFAKGGRSFITADCDMRLAAMLRMPVVSLASETRNWGLVFTPSSCQEVVDSVIAAYWLAEQEKVLLPACILMDAVTAQTYEQCEIPTGKIVENFLGRLQPDSKHFLHSVRSFEDKMMLQKSMDNAGKLFPSLSQEWKKRFRRAFDMFEGYMLEGADFAFVVYGSNANNCRIAVNKLRSQGERVGMLKLNVLRPWPEDLLRQILHGKRLAVVDNVNALSLGGWSKLYHAVKTVTDSLALNFIYDRLVTPQQFEEMFHRLKAAERAERVWIL